MTQTARDAAVELAVELSEAGSLDSRYVRIHEDEMEPGSFDVRIELPRKTIHPQMLSALGERGCWLEALGRVGGRYVFLIKTDGAVHEGVY